MKENFNRILAVSAAILGQAYLPAALGEETLSSHASEAISSSWPAADSSIASALKTSVPEAQGTGLLRPDASVFAPLTAEQLEKGKSAKPPFKAFLVPTEIHQDMQEIRRQTAKDAPLYSADNFAKNVFLRLEPNPAYPPYENCSGFYRVVPGQVFFTSVQSDENKHFVLAEVERTDDPQFISDVAAYSTERLTAGLAKIAALAKEKNVKVSMPEGVPGQREDKTFDPIEFDLSRDFNGSSSINFRLPEESFKLAREIDLLGPRDVLHLSNLSFKEVDGKTYIIAQASEVDNYAVQLGLEARNAAGITEEFGRPCFKAMDRLASKNADLTPQELKQNCPECSEMIGSLRISEWNPPDADMSAAIRDHDLIRKNPFGIRGFKGGSRASALAPEAGP